MKLRTVVGLTLLGIVFGLLVKSRLFYPLDLAVGHQLQLFQPFWLVRFNSFISLFELGVVIITLPLAGWFWRRGQKGAAKLMLLAALAWVVNRLLKTGFGLVCPTPLELNKFSVVYSFSYQVNQVFGPAGLFNPFVCYPSGHVFNYVSVWGVIFFLRRQITVHPFRQKLIAVLSIILIIAIGEAVISLGAHWFSDVLGGYLLGFAYLLFITGIYERYWQNS